MSSIDEVMFCEACEDLLNTGDLGTPTTRGGHLCRHCSPKLSEAVAEYNAAIASGERFKDYGFTSIGEMKARLRDMVHELTTLGDCNIAVPL